MKKTVVLFCLPLLILVFPVYTYDFHETVHADTVPRSIKCILGTDIGATNSDFGFFSEVSGKPVLLFTLHTKTKTVDDFSDLVIHVLDYARNAYQIQATKACFGAPGPRSEKKDYSKASHMGFAVDANDIKLRTGLKTVLVVNDFEVIGYGIDLIDQKNVVQLQKGAPRQKALKVIIGAGSGLGVSFFIWNDELQRYQDFGSEAGGSEFPARTAAEFTLKKVFGYERLSWGALLSGPGISYLYRAVCQNKNVAEFDRLEEDSPAQIFARYDTDHVCRETINWYLELYARFAGQVGLSMLPFGGLYIVGGTAIKNHNIFKNGMFMRVFLDDDQFSWREKILNDIPVYLISDYNVSLYGAAQYLLNERGNCMIVTKFDIQNYYKSGKHNQEIQEILEAAWKKLKNTQVSNKSLVVIDIDETALSNYKYFEKNNWKKDSEEGLHNWMILKKCTAITPLLRFYKKLIAKGFKVVFISARPNELLSETRYNLVNQGYETFEQIILRSSPKISDQAFISFKSQNRQKLVDEGYEIIACVGDQWSDLKGENTGLKIKLPTHFEF